MVRMTVLYGQPADPGAFERYYAELHVPIALKIPGMVRIEAAKAGPAPGGAPPAYYRLADLWFADEGQLHAALGSPEGQAAVQDLANFATGGVTVLYSEVTAAMGDLPA